ncbi:hypothetical protein COO60DRAFT_1233474 [Scenedesmus sp. NREL 46B-D3]|nr:hypothetical protein COO60DRAFT_1233474 [Scenedesmus sp. NREL 46B-D3]
MQNSSCIASTSACCVTIKMHSSAALDNCSSPCFLVLLLLQLFANSDIGNLTKNKACCPPKDYMEAQWGRCPPVQCERDRSFDFRRFCSTKNEKEDPSMEEEGAEWNEMRAVLNTDNMVGLLYIHDPQFTPQQHADLAKKLCANFGGELEMGVLKMHEPGGHQGDLLLVDDSAGEADANGKADSAAGASGDAKGATADAAAQAHAEGAAQKEERGQQQQQQQQGEEEQQEQEGEQQQQQAKRQKLGEELAAAAEAPEGQDADGPASCRLMSFWEYLEQCR